MGSLCGFLLLLWFSDLATQTLFLTLLYCTNTSAIIHISFPFLYSPTPPPSSLSIPPPSSLLPFHPSSLLHPPFSRFHAFNSIHPPSSPPSLSHTHLSHLPSPPFFFLSHTLPSFSPTSKTSLAKNVLIDTPAHECLVVIIHLYGSQHKGNYQGTHITVSL